jgi:ACT domain-containing protein
MKKIIVTVLGPDRVGIIARVCTLLSERNVNILDISQTVLSGYFHMAMVADAAACTETIEELFDELDALGQELGTRIQGQSEEIFQMMHRI